MLGTMLNWAVESELLDSEPDRWYEETRAGERRGIECYRTPKIATIWHALEGAAGWPMMWPEALRLLLLTGQRPGEIASPSR